MVELEHNKRTEDLIKLLEAQRKQYIKFLKQCQEAISEEVADVIYEIALQNKNNPNSGWTRKPEGYDIRKNLKIIFKDAK